MKNIILIIFLLFVLNNCSSDSIENNTPKIGKISVEGAKSLLLTIGANNTSVKDTTQTINNLLKLTDSGYIEEVLYYDEERNLITEVQQPREIYNVNDQYVIICFGEATGKGSSFDGYPFLLTGYLIRKSDGKVFFIS
jgi:hypothetical protein